MGKRDTFSYDNFIIHISWNVILYLISFSICLRKTQWHEGLFSNQIQVDKRPSSSRSFGSFHDLYGQRRRSLQPIPYRPRGRFTKRGQKKRSRLGFVSKRNCVFVGPPDGFKACKCLGIIFSFSCEIILLLRKRKHSFFGLNSFSNKRRLRLEIRKYFLKRCSDVLLYSSGNLIVPQTDFRVQWNLVSFFSILAKLTPEVSWGIYLKMNHRIWGGLPP